MQRVQADYSLGCQVAHDAWRFNGVRLDGGGIAGDILPIECRKTQRLVTFVRRNVMCQEHFFRSAPVRCRRNFSARNPCTRWWRDDELRDACAERLETLQNGLQ